MKTLIESVVAITPVWNEPLGMIQKFLEAVDGARKKLVDKGIGFRHFFLDDAALHLPDEYSILVRHQKNEGLAKTLVDGYEAVLGLRSLPDLVIRLDCQEHDASQIPFVVDHFSHASMMSVLFLPVWYWVKGHDRPMMKDITGMITDFVRSLSPIRRQAVLEIYNKKFPLGYQAFRLEILKSMLPLLEQGLNIFKEKTGKPATWGLDLLAIFLAAKDNPQAMDFVFGGWAEPWQENRGTDKIEAQRQKAITMVEVAEALGCVVLPEGD